MVISSPTTTRLFHPTSHRFVRVTVEARVEVIGPRHFRLDFDYTPIAELQARGDKGDYLTP